MAFPASKKTQRFSDISDSFGRLVNYCAGSGVFRPQGDGENGKFKFNEQKKWWICQFWRGVKVSKDCETHCGQEVRHRCGFLLCWLRPAQDQSWLLTGELMRRNLKLVKRQTMTNCDNFLENWERSENENNFWCFYFVWSVFNKICAITPFVRIVCNCIPASNTGTGQTS